MKIAVYHPFLYPWRLDFCQALSKHVGDITFYTTRIKSSYPSAVSGIRGDYPSQESNLHILEVPSLNILGDILPHPRLLTKFLRDKPDLLIIFATETTGSLLLYAAAKIRKVKVALICEKNADNRAQLPWLVRVLTTAKRVLAKTVHKNASIRIAESIATKDYLVELGCSPNTIYVYPHGVNTSRFRPQVPNYEFAKSIGIQQEDLKKTTVLYAGGFYSHKGIEYLAEAMKSDLLKDIIFLIIRYGSQLSRYEPMFEKQQNARFLPLIGLDDMINLYSISDIVILPSIATLVAEISPNVLLEAMACGKAIIATNIGGIPDMLSNCGLLIPERDSEGIVEAISKLASDAELRAYYGRLARQRAEEVLSIDKYADKILNLCRPFMKC